jgi:hypothetical protein
MFHYIFFMFGKNTIDNHQLTCFPGTYLPRDTDNIETWLLIHLTILLVFHHHLTCFPGTYLPRDTDDIETWLLIHLTILLVFQ